MYFWFPEGIVNSPQILLNSGIGPREELEAIGIPVIHDLPGVGKNLHDHFNTLINFSINETVYNDVNWASALDYLLYRKGPLSGIGKNSFKRFKEKKMFLDQERKPLITNQYIDIKFTFISYPNRKYYSRWTYKVKISSSPR